MNKDKNSKTRLQLDLAETLYDNHMLKVERLELLTDLINQENPLTTSVFEVY